MKLPEWWHDLNFVTGRKLVGNELREPSAGLHPDSQHQRLLAGHRADAVSPANLFAVDGYLNREMLSWQECVLILQMLRYLQSHAHRIGGFPIDTDYIE